MKDLLLLQPPENRKERKSEPGYFKDESGQKIIYYDIVAVKPKIYHSVLGYKKKKKILYFLNLIHS